MSTTNCNPTVSSRNARMESAAHSMRRPSHMQGNFILCACPAYPAAIYEKKKGFAPFALLRSKSREGTHLMRRSTATFGDCGRHDRFPSPLKTGKKLCPCVQPLPNSPAHHISPTPMQEASKIHAAVTLGYTRSKKGPEGPFGALLKRCAKERGPNQKSSSSSLTSSTSSSRLGTPSSA